MSEEKKTTTISIKNHRNVEFILGAINLPDPAMPGQTYTRAAESIAPGCVSQPMPPHIFKMFDVPSVAEAVAAGELEIFVDGASKTKPKAKPHAAPQNVAEALAQKPTPSAESVEGSALEDLLAPKPS